MQRGSKPFTLAAASTNPIPIVPTAFVAPEIFGREDASRRKERLAQIVATEIVPRLHLLHKEVLGQDDAEAIPEADIVRLAHMVLSPNLQAAAAYVTFLRDRGLPMETLFVELLQPAAQHLGKMWDNEECDFIDVTLGVGQLQKLLAIFNSTQALPALDAKRRVFLTLAPGEQHSLGLSMITRLLRAAGWHVTVGSEPTLAGIKAAVGSEWFAVAGITQSPDVRLDDLTTLVAGIRKHSRNPSIGVMVGGPSFAREDNLLARVCADGTATDATTAVLLTQKLFDLGARTGWYGTSP